jgi:hypothetical protein
VKSNAIELTVVSPPECERLVVELEHEGDSLVTVSMEGDAPVVELEHPHRRVATRLPLRDVVEASRAAERELLKTSGRERLTPE